ncbi:MAG: hypothetical protein A2W99_02325 [Bacteroidetes bacterium GWF2_33_16]|nr:MAG: hypothetical protein A2X00_15830 [Bacteroidetes bacterium GWE2_32_14]OFY07099.1 MAG: hypothetical protein A2W99_02325 [Bacteroidetes bacterium GWF2_33_16]
MLLATKIKNPGFPDFLLLAICTLKYHTGSGANSTTSAFAVINLRSTVRIFLNNSTHRTSVHGGTMVILGAKLFVYNYIFLHFCNIFKFVAKLIEFLYIYI